MSRLDFLYRRELPHRAVSVYIYLADRVNKEGQCWPAIPTIARELKLSQSTVRQGGTMPSWWKVVPVMVTGERELPTLRVLQQKRKYSYFSYEIRFYVCTCRSGQNLI